MRCSPWAWLRLPQSPLLLGIRTGAGTEAGARAGTAVGKIGTGIGTAFPIGGIATRTAGIDGGADAGTGGETVSATRGIVTNIRAPTSIQAPTGIDVPIGIRDRIDTDRIDTGGTIWIGTASPITGTATETVTASGTAGTATRTAGGGANLGCRAQRGAEAAPLWAWLTYPGSLRSNRRLNDCVP